MFGISRQAYYKKSVRHGYNSTVEVLLLGEFRDLRLEQPVNFLRRHGLLVKQSRTTVITTTAGSARCVNLYAEADLTGPGVENLTQLPQRVPPSTLAHLHPARFGHLN
ncbi:MAG: hypothetical protein ACC655_10190 [Rhodothermia bacterium]